MSHIRVQTTYALLLALIIPSYSAVVPYPAITAVPVAELVGDPVQKSTLETPIEQTYLTMPLDLPFGEKKPDPFPLCPRVHQLLLHERITVIEERGEEVRLVIPNLFFILATQQTPHCSYWTLKKNILPLALLSQEQQEKIPAAISFAEKRITVPNSLALIYPVTDTITEQTFSAGTRFIYETEVQDKHYYHAYAYDGRDMTIKPILLPKKYCMPPAAEGNEQKIKQFVALLRAWAHLKHGAISYVWGGRSFTTKKNSAQIRTITANGWNYKIAEQHPGAKSGFDCSSLVATAAQLCTIPYFYKNSTTAAALLAPLQPNEALTEGDIIVTIKPNHVMIVSDLKKNKLIEARTIAHGYGTVHEIPLHEEFQNIRSYQDLIHAYHNHIPLKRLRKDGSAIATIPQFHLLKLASVWR